MLVAVAGFIFGIILGSYTKATADRLSRKEPLGGRSYCVKCRTNLRWYDLFPVLSFLQLRGRCRYCHHKIPLGNFLNEVGLGIIMAGVFVRILPADLTTLSYDLGTGLLILNLLFAIFVVSVIAVIFWTDLTTGLIPDRVTYPAAIITLVYLLVADGLKSWAFYQNLLINPFGKYLLPPYTNYLQDNLERIWLASGYTILAAIAAASIFALLIVGTRGRGMGWGDVKYVFWLGLSVGFPNIIPAILLAFFTGAVFSVGLILIGKKHFGQTIPFGPFLGLGAVLALLWGNQLIGLYL